MDLQIECDHIGLPNLKTNQLKLWGKIFSYRSFLIYAASTNSISNFFLSIQFHNYRRSYLRNNERIKRKTQNKKIYKPKKKYIKRTQEENSSSHNRTLRIDELNKKKKSFLWTFHFISSFVPIYIYISLSFITISFAQSILFISLFWRQPGASTNLM